MCGRFALHNPITEISKSIGAEDLEIIEFEPSYNIGPQQNAPVYVNGETESGTSVPTAKLMKWGLRPKWSKKSSQEPINARVETIETKPMFSEAFAKRRCLVPANGWYEWSVDKAQKTPWFHYRLDKEILFFAGVWESWSDNAGNSRESFAIITQNAHENISHVHHRMPVIIEKKHCLDWLNGAGITDLGTSVKIANHPVSKDVNSIKSHGKNLIKKIPTLF